MDARATRMLTLLVVAVVASAAAFAGGRDGTFASPQAAADTARISAEERAAGLRFAATVAAGDRAWIEDAIARARPEAQALVAEVDGLVEMGTHRGLPIGYTESVMRGDQATFAISFDTVLLNGRRTTDRDVVVMHELGHAIDLALVPQALNDRLDAQIPRTGTCVNDSHGLAGSCTEPVERFVRFSVADTGPGIRAEDLSHIFERYWQSTRTATLGTGLGLTIAKGIVEAHGGSIGIDSELGSGTRVWFTLPATGRLVEHADSAGR